MKRIFVIFVCFVVVLLNGCTSAPPSNYFLSTLPWTPDTYVHTLIGEEQATYLYTRYKGSSTSETPTIITTNNSTVVYHLREGYSFDLQDQTIDIVKDENSTLLTTTTFLEYKMDQNVDLTYRGETETMTTYAVFHRYNLGAIKAYQNAQTIESAHTLYIDYKQKTATYNDDQGTKSLKIKKDGYDNVSVFYLFRALNSIKQDGSQVMPVILAYDDFMFDRSSVKAVEIAQSTANEPIDIEVEPQAYSIFNADNTQTKLSCFNTTLALNQKKSGPLIKLYYSMQETRINSVNSVSYKAKNVLVKSESYVYGYLSGTLSLDYTNTLTLIGYTNK